MQTILFLALAFWPFTPRPLPAGRHHTIAASTERLARIQAHRHHRLRHAHGAARPSLTHHR